MVCARARAPLPFVRPPSPFIHTHTHNHTHPHIQKRTPPENTTRNETHDPPLRVKRTHGKSKCKSKCKAKQSARQTIRRGLLFLRPCAWARVPCRPREASLTLERALGGKVLSRACALPSRARPPSAAAKSAANSRAPPPPPPPPLLLCPELQRRAHRRRRLVRDRPRRFSLVKGSGGALRVRSYAAGVRSSKRLFARGFDPGEGGSDLDFVMT